MSKGDKAIQNFEKAVYLLQKALWEAQSIWPDAEIYVAGSTFNLMSGPHHEGLKADARQDRVLASHRVEGLDVGDW